MESLKIYNRPPLKNPRMVLGFSGWMDGGNVSTGTISYLKHKLNTKRFAEIDAQPFYLFNFPGAMLETAQFRPDTHIKDGLLADFKYPLNEFFYDEKSNIILFSGKEPNILWNAYADCIFEIAREFEVKKMCFAGSVAGMIPHSRRVRISGYFSDKRQKEKMSPYNIRLSNYRGPASITTLITKLATERNIEMTNFVAEIPMYIQTQNPKGIKAVIERIAHLLDINIDLSDLSKEINNFEKRIDKLVQQQPQLFDQIKKLEKNYDKEYLEEKDGFEEWLKQHGIDKL